MNVYAVGVALEFQSSAKAVLGETVTATDAAAESVERLTGSMRTAESATSAFMKSQRALQRSMGVSAKAVEAAQARFDTAFAGMRDSAVSSNETMAASTADAAKSIDTSTKAMTRRFGAVTRSVRRTTAAIADMTAASKAVAGAAAIPIARRGGGALQIGASGLLAGGPAGFVASKTLGVAKGAAVAGAVMGVDALYEAGRYQATMQAIQNLTGAQKWQMQQIRTLTFEQGAQTALAPTQMAKLLLDIARQTPSLSIAQKEQMLPYVARTALVLGNTRGMSPEASSEAAINFVHLFQAYKPEQLGPTFDAFVRSAEMMGVSPTRAVTQYAYFVPGANRLGVNPTQDVVLMAELANMGMGKQRGGTGIANMLASFVGEGVGGAKATAALKQLGILDQNGRPLFYARGRDGQMHLDLLKALDQLNVADRKRGDLAFFGLTKAAFGANAMRTVNALTSNVQTQQRNVTAARMMQPSLGLDEQYRTLMGMLPNQVKQTTANFQALAIELGGLMLPAATIGFRDLGGALHDAQVWLHQNKNAEHDFMQALMGDVNLVARTIDSHRHDFEAIGGNIAFLAGIVNTLGKGAVLAFGPLTTLVRIMSDIATVNFDDANRLIGDLRSRNAQAQINQIRDRNARVMAWKNYVTQFGVEGIPQNVLNSIYPRVTGGGGWGPSPSSAHPVAPPPGSNVPDWMRGPMPSGHGMDLSRPRRVPMRRVAEHPATSTTSRTSAKVPKKSRSPYHPAADANTVIAFTGTVNMKVDGADAVRAHRSIIAGAHDLVERHLPKSHPLKPGLTGSGVTIGDALLG